MKHYPLDCEKSARVFQVHFSGPAKLRIRTLFTEFYLHHIRPIINSYWPSIVEWEMFVFWKIWPALFSCYLRLEIRFFTLLPTTLLQCYTHSDPGNWFPKQLTGFYISVALTWYKLTFYVPMPQNGKVHSNNSFKKFGWVCLNILWYWRLKD